MAANAFVTLNVPDQAGTGTPADVSGLAPTLSIIVDGPVTSNGEIVLEISENGTDFAPITEIFPIHNPPSTLLPSVVAKFARIRRFSGFGEAFVALGAIATSANSFADLSKIPIDTSSFGPEKTIVVTGQYPRAVVIEGSTDGTSYDVVASFNTLDSDVVTIRGVFVSMRLRDSSDVPESVSVGAGFSAGGAGPTAGAVSRIIAGTNVTLSPSSGVGNVTVNATGGGGGGITGVTTDANDSTLHTTDPSGPTVVISQTGTAGWPISNARIYAVDSTRPDNDGQGFADMTGTSEADYQAASVAAGAVAKKTVAGLFSVFPKFGNGRIVEIQMNAEGDYEADELNSLLDGVTGYKKIIVRSTGTVPTAGTTKFDGTELDCTVVGGTTGIGMNAAGYNSDFWFNAYGGHSQKVGGADPNWSHPAGLPLGIRLRFDQNTTTVVIRNECRQVCRVPDHDQTVCQTPFAAHPDGSDLFYAEQPGVVLNGNYDIRASLTQEIVFVGMHWTGNIFSAQGLPNFVFCMMNNLPQTTSNVNSGIKTSQSYDHFVYGTETPGGGLLVEGNIDIESGIIQVEGLVSIVQIQITAPTPGTMIFGAGNAANNFVFNKVYGTTSNDPNNPKVFSDIGTDNTELAGIPNTFGEGPLASIVLNGCYVRIGECAFRNCGGKPVFKLFGKNWVGFVGAVNAVSDGEGANIGMDVTQSTQSEIEVESIPPDIRGTQGDIVLAGSNPVYGTLWGDIQGQDVWDRAGNHFFYALATSGTFRTPPNVVESFWNNTAAPGRFGLAMMFAGVQVQAADLSLIDDVSGLFGLSEQTPVLHSTVYIRPMSGVSHALLDANGSIGQAVYVSQTPGMCTVNPPIKQIYLGVIVDEPGTTPKVQWVGPQNRPATIENWLINRLNDRWYNAQWDYDYDTFNDLAVDSRWDRTGVFGASADLPMGNQHIPSGGTFSLDKSTVKTVADAANSLWAIGGYGKMGVTVNAADQRRFRIRDDLGTNWAAIGTDAIVNVIKYVFSISKNGVVKTALSTVSVDGLPHKFLLIRTTTQILGRVDNEPWVVVTNDIPTDGPVGDLWEVVEGITTSDVFDVGAAFIATLAT